MNNYNGYGADRGYGSAPVNGQRPKKPGAVAAFAIIAFMAVICCLPIMGPAFNIIVGYKTEILDETKKYDTEVQAVVIDVKEQTVNYKDGPETHYIITYEYTYNGERYLSANAEEYAKQYRSKGEKVDIKIKSDSPREFYDPAFFEDSMKVYRILLWGAFAVILIPLIIVIVVIMLLRRASKRRKQANIDIYGVDLYSMEERDPNDDYRG